MKRTPMRRKKPLRQRRAEGADVEREVKPWAATLSSTTLKPIRAGSYSGETSGQRVDKDAPVRSEAYRRLVAAMPCMLCGASPCQAAHPNTGKGMGIKADDRACFPLCPRCHGLFDQGVCSRRKRAANWSRHGERRRAP